MKVLIYWNKNMLAPIGGPNGYLFGLMSQLERNECDSVEISFLDKPLPKKSKLKEYGKQTKNRFLSSVAQILKIYFHHKRLIGILKNKKTPEVDLNEYDVIHFHATMHLYQLRDCLKDYKGKVVLTSHSPQPLSMELIEEGSGFERNFFRKEYSKLIEMDQYAFERADYILFPCEHADEPYDHQWSDYKRIKESRKDCYRYLVTGTAPAKIVTDRIDVRRKLNIPDDAFVISYVGRHNKIKGYDRLKDICKEFLEAHPDVYVVVAGKEEPIKGLDHPHWIEIGWTNEPHSYVNASDVFVLPNRETYFDLVLLEVLSTGKIAVISETGGNKYFKRFENAGIEYFSNTPSAVSALEKVYRMSGSERQEKEKRNKDIYTSCFTTAVFAKNYIDFYKTIALEKTE